MKARHVLALTVSSALLAACGGGSNSTGVAPPPPTNVGVQTARFDPATAVIPFPNNLLRLGSTDGTINAPVANANNFGDPAVALNALDGFSTVAPWATTFSAPVNAATITAGVNVRVFEVTTTAQGAVTGVVRQLTAGTEFATALSPTDTSGRTLVIIPTQALKPLTSYMAVLTNGITDTSGNTATPDTTYFLAKRTTQICNGAVSLDPLIPSSSCPTLETLRQLTNAQEAAAASQGVPAANIVLSWVATTQSTTQVLGQMRPNANYVQARTISAVNISGAPFFVTPSAVNPALANNFNIHVGRIALPYLLLSNTQAAIWPTASPRPGPLGGFWIGAGGSNVTVFNPAPVIQSTQTVPLLVNVPVTPKPVNGWPVVIFQHGITRNRTDAFAISNALAQAGFAVVAIDAPLHGVAAASTLGGGGAIAGATGQASTERTFSVDYVNNTTGAPGPDGVVDGSGTHFINLASLLTSRDNIRQAILDLMNLRASISSLNVDGVAGGDFDNTKVYFAGQSLGGIIGASFATLEPNITRAFVSVPGGGIAQLLNGSATFGPQIRAGLAASGVTFPSANFDQFMVVAQTAVDSADPVNLARSSVSATDAVLMHEVIGGTTLSGGVTNLPDQVVPNSVNGAPLSGTEPLQRAMGLTSIVATTANAAGVRGITRFTKGEHGSLLSPARSAIHPPANPAGFVDVTTEMQGEMVSFFFSNGQQVNVGNTAIIRTTP